MRKAGQENKGERKPVSILFVDVVGSTSMAEKLDPEDWQTIITGAHRSIGDVIYRYEGTVAQLLGDGMLAFFGAPIAHEDDPIRAVHAALDILEAIKSYRRGLANSTDDFQVRAGISTGTVVIGDIGTDLHVEYLAFGDSVNVAARLQSAAKPGEVLITAETHKRIAPCFKTQNLGKIRVKGKTASVQAYRILGARSEMQPQRGIPGLSSPLVGRSIEVQALSNACEGLLAGNGGVVTVVGEAGIGKSRLIREFHNQLNDCDLRWIEGRCLSYGRSTPYLLWVDILKKLFELGTTGLHLTTHQQLKSALVTLCPTKHERIFPFLGSLLSLPLDAEQTTIIQNLKAEDLRDCIFHAVRVVVEAIANDLPLVLVCEDLHWADLTSLALLERILDLTEWVPLMIIRIMRPEGTLFEGGRGQHEFQNMDGRHTSIHLAPLEEAGVHQLVANLLPAATFPAGLSQKILTFGAGNPFYVEEILRSWIDCGIISQEEDEQSWIVKGEILEIDVPDTVQGVLLARMDRLPPDARQLLQTSAVIGRTFDLQILDRISHQRTDLHACLRELEYREFIYKTSDQTVGAYTFRHALTQEVAYDTLLRRHRRKLHLDVGTALEAFYDPHSEERLETLAFHFLKAEVWDKAWNYHRLAGQKAKDSFANPEAVALLEATIEIAGHIPHLSPSQIAEVCCWLADVFTGINQYESAMRWLDRGLDILLSAEADVDVDIKMRAQINQKKGQILRSVGDYESAIEVIQEGLRALPRACSHERGALKLAMASALTRMGELETAQQWCTAGIADAEECGDFAELAHGYSLLGTIRRDLGDTSASLSSRQMSLEISQNIDDIPLQMEAHNNLAVAYYDLGQLSCAIEHYQQSLELSEVIGNLNTGARARINLGEVYLIQGDWVQAEQAFYKALTIWDQTGYMLGQAYGAAQMGAVLCLQGKQVEAKTFLLRSQELFSELGARSFLPTVDCFWAAVYLSVGDLEAAESHCLCALELARELALLHPEGTALRLFGELHRARGSLTQAKTYLNQSIQIFRDAGICYEEAKGLKELASVYVASGESERVKPLLNQAIELFEALGAKFDLQDAQALAARLPRQEF
jgi:class 3 adenylate cyclase/tetratricopeptide (TPR) repeat protein